MVGYDSICNLDDGDEEERPRPHPSPPPTHAGQRGTGELHKMCILHWGKGILNSGFQIIFSLPKNIQFNGDEH